jgi:hypothetical protein
MGLSMSVHLSRIFRNSGTRGPIIVEQWDPRVPIFVYQWDIGSQCKNDLRSLLEDTVSQQ